MSCWAIPPRSRSSTGTSTSTVTGTTRPFFDRTSLPVGVQKRGPMVVEQQDSTIVVPHGFALSIDESYHLVIERDEG